MTSAERSCLDTLIAALSDALAAKGFGPVSSVVNLGKAHRLTWCRPGAWKTDCVSLDYGLHSLKKGVLMQVHVVFGDAPGGRIETGTTVGYVVGRSNTEHYFPVLLSWRCPGFIRGVLTDVLCALKWFERSATTSACRSFIAAEDTNISAQERDRIAALLCAVDDMQA